MPKVFSPYTAVPTLFISSQLQRRKLLDTFCHACLASLLLGHLAPLMCSQLCLMVEWKPDSRMVAVKSRDRTVGCNTECIVSEKFTPLPGKGVFLSGFGSLLAPQEIQVQLYFFFSTFGFLHPQPHIRPSLDRGKKQNTRWFYLDTMEPLYDRNYTIPVQNTFFATLPNTMLHKPRPAPSSKAIHPSNLR